MENIQKSDYMILDMFSDPTIPLTNIALLGKSTTGKTKLMKIAIDLLVKSGRKVMIFDSTKEYEEVTNKLSGLILTDGQPNLKILDNYSVVNIQTFDIDFMLLTQEFVQDKNEWIVVVDGIDIFVPLTSTIKKVMEFIGFLCYISELGKNHNTYTFISARDVELIDNNVITKKIYNNSKSLIFFKQNLRSLKYMGNKKILTSEQVNFLKDLKQGETVLIMKK